MQAAEEHWEFTATIPPGTPASAPLLTRLTMPVRRVTGISWMVPPGPSGLAGWQIAMAGVQVVPVNIGAWLVRDGSINNVELAGLPDSGAWQIIGYNAGTFPHTFYLTMLATAIRKQPAVGLPGRLGLQAARLGMPSGQG